jgi:hypothetical protein
VGLSASKSGEAVGAFPLDQGLKRFANERRALLESSEGVGLSEELIVESESGSHVASVPTVASDDLLFRA